MSPSRRGRRRRTLSDVTGAQRGFQIHATVWFAVNAFLFLIWAMTGMGFPWFLIPAAATSRGTLLRRERTHRSTHAGKTSSMASAKATACSASVVGSGGTA